MSISIISNPQSIATQRHMGRTERALNTSLSRLASGLRIVRASDDAAGLAISESLRAQTRSLAVARRNAADGISLAQTAEAALNEQSGILMRMRELAVQAANGTLSTGQRAMLHDEFHELREEFGRIEDTTDFNGVDLLGTHTTVTLQVGITGAANDRITVSTLESTSSAITVSSSTVNLNDFGLSTVARAQSALATTSALDQAIENVSKIRSNFGVIQNRLQITIERLHNAEENMMAAESRIRDADIASETSQMTRNQILMQAGASMLAQANQLPALAMSLIG